MHEIMRKVCDALKNIEDADFSIMSEKDRKIVSELVDLKKNILKTERLENEMNDGHSLAVTVDGQIGMGERYSRNARRDNMGRYSRDDGMGGGSYRRGRYSRDGGYSYAGGIEEMMDKASEMLDSAENEQQKQAIRRFMKELERM